MVALLLRRGARVDARNAAGQTPLFSATYSCWGRVIRLLLAAGANAGAVDEEGTTALDRLCAEPLCNLLECANKDEKDELEKMLREAMA